MENTQKSPWAWWILGAIIVIALVWWAKAGGVAVAPVAKETGPIKIGAVAPLTGDAAAYGLPIQRSINLAVDEANKAGGINGRQVELIWEDGKCTGTDAVTAAQKLLNVDQVKYIFGGLCSSESLAMVPLTQEARVLLINGVSSSPDLTKAGDLFFRTYPSDAFAGQVMASYASKDLHAERVAVISENTDFAQGLRKVFTSAFTGDVSVDETYNTGTTDFRTFATKVKEANVDAVYVVAQTFTPAQLIIRQLREAGVTAVILGSDPLLDRKLVTENAALFEGIILPELGIDDSNEKTKAFLDAYKAAYNTDPEFPSYMAAAVDATNLTFEAMRAGNMTPEAIATYFNTNVKDWPGTVGTFNFDADGDAILQLNLRKIEKGSFTDLGPYKL